MFRITYRPKEDRDHSVAEFCTDIKDLGDIVLNVTGSIQEAENAMKWCGDANFGSKIIRQPNYKIECINEVELSKDLEKTINYITNILGLTYRFISFESDALIYTVDDGTSRIGLKANGEYFVTINRITDNKNNIETVFTYHSKNEDDFQQKTVLGIENLMRKTLNKTSNTKNNNVWHKRYWSGKNTKQDANDSIREYYKDSGETIAVNYIDWRHKEVACYSARDKFGNHVATTTRLYEAQKVLDTRK